MVIHKRHIIVVEKHTDEGPVFERDEVLMESIIHGGWAYSTAKNGTILARSSGVEFGPNCPNGVAIYEKV